MQLLKSLLLLTSIAFTSTTAQTPPNYPKSVKISYEIIGSSSTSASPLAEIQYDPTTLKHYLASWTPPSIDTLKSTSQDPTSSPLVRILLPNNEGSGSGSSSTVTSLSTFDSALSQDITIWLSSGDSDASIFSVSITSISPAPLTEEEKRQKRKEERALAKGKPLPKPSPKSKPKKPSKKDITPPPVSPESDTQTPGPVVKISLRQTTAGPTPKLLSRAPKVDAEGREIETPDVPEKTFFQKYWWVFLVGTVLMMGGGGGGDGK